MCLFLVVTERMHLLYNTSIFRILCFCVLKVTIAAYVRWGRIKELIRRNFAEVGRGLSCWSTGLSFVFL